MTSVPMPIPSRTQYVLDAIKHRILTGQLTPGQALVETELAAQFGVSKTPVREALKTLAGTGLVVMNQYKGVTVRMVDADMAREVYDVRLLLEPEALKRAVRRGASLDAARAALTRADAAGDTAERSLANREFHRALYLPCGNPLLGRMLDEVRDQAALVSAVAWAASPSWEREAGLERFVWVAGLAEPYAPSYFSAGATGFTSGLVNVAPSVSLNMIEALRSGDYPAAMKVWEQIRRFEELRAAGGSANNVTVVKEALASLGLCRRDIRPPSRLLPEAERAEVAGIAAGWSL